MSGTASIEGVDSVLPSWSLVSGRMSKSKDRRVTTKQRHNKRMEGLKKSAAACVMDAKQAYDAMLHAGKMDPKALVAIFDQLLENEADLPRLLEHQPGPTPIFVFNVCYMTEEVSTSTASRRVPVLQVSGGFFPNLERPLVCMTVISIVDAHLREGTRARPDPKKAPLMQAPPPSQIEVHKISRQPPFGYSYRESPKGATIQRARDGI